jgi:transposase
LRSERDGDESPLFPPQHQTAEQASNELVHTLGQAPEVFGQPGTRWRLATLGETIAWLAGYGSSAISACLKRLGIHLKRGQHRLYSPDAAYAEKLRLVARRFEQAKASGGREVFLFADELTFYRQPGLARVFARAGRAQPRITLSYKSNTSGRIAAVLNAVSGQVDHLIANVISIPTLVRFHSQVRAAYPDAERIWMALDNWPVHFHPDVVAALEEQQHGFEVPLPPSWPREPRAKAKRLHLPIQFLPLPTYAPWTNPIEKLWRWLRQSYLHMHREADDWPTLKQKISDHLNEFACGSEDLLRYVGLASNSPLYGEIVAPTT